MEGIYLRGDRLVEETSAVASSSGSLLVSSGDLSLQIVKQAYGRRAQENLAALGDRQHAVTKRQDRAEKEARTRMTFRMPRRGHMNVERAGSKERKSRLEFKTRRDHAHGFTSKVENLPFPDGGSAA
jgi:hypothetical protein